MTSDKLHVKFNILIYNIKIFGIINLEQIYTQFWINHSPLPWAWLYLLIFLLQHSETYLICLHTIHERNLLHYLRHQTQRRLSRRLTDLCHILLQYYLTKVMNLEDNLSQSTLIIFCFSFFYFVSVCQLHRSLSYPHQIMDENVATRRISYPNSLIQSNQGSFIQ